MSQRASAPEGRAAGSAQVFLVGVGVDAHGFAAFCRQHLVDFVAGETGLRTFLLRREGDTSPLQDVDHLFGRWPVEFSGSQDLRDALVEAVSDHLEKGPRRSNLAAIVVVANRPSDLLSGDLFAPMRAELASGRLPPSRLWTVAALMSGPGFEPEAVAKLVAPQLGASESMFLNVFLLGEDVRSPGYEMGGSHAQPLRSIIDLVRDDGGGWARFRPKLPTGRVLWFSLENEAVPLRSRDVLGYLKGVMEVLSRRSRGGKEAETFKAGVAEQLEALRPEMGSAKSESYKDPPRLLDGSGYARNALDGLAAFARRQGFPGYADQAHADLLAETRRFVEQEDDRRERLIEDMERRTQGMPLPSGGQSDSARITAAQEIRTVDAAQKGWEDEARRERQRFFDDHRALQARPDPGSRGRLAFGMVAGEREFPGAVEAAACAAGDLPANRLSLFVLAAMAPLLLATAAILQLWSKYAANADALPSGGSRWQAVVGLFRVRPEGGWLPLCVGLGLLAALPAALVLLSKRRHRKAQKETFARVRQTADAIRAFIVEAMDGARGYSLKTRSALLAKEFARLLGARVSSEPRLILDDQQAKFLASVPTSGLERDEEGRVRASAAITDPKLLVRRLAKDRLASLPADGAWNMVIARETFARGFAVEIEAAVNAPVVTVPSRWIDGAHDVILIPVAWQGAGNKEPARSQRPSEAVTGHAE